MYAVMNSECTALSVSLSGDGLWTDTKEDKELGKKKCSYSIVRVWKGRENVRKGKRRVERRVR